MESVSVRKKVDRVRQENAPMTMPDEELICNLNNQSQVRLRGSRVNNDVVVMSEQIRQLEAELQDQTQETKAAELRAECCQEAAAHSDIVVMSLTEELNTLKEELDSRTALGRRAEQQRNQALQNAEQLKEAFKNYKATISIQLEKVMESESKLKQSLVKCDREKEELEMKCTVLEEQKTDQSQKISELKEEVEQAQTAATALKAGIEEANHKTSHLRQQLVERGAECRVVASLRGELEVQRSLTNTLELQVAKSQKEAETSQAQLASLETVLALLHIQEGAGGHLCANPCMLPPMDYSGTVHLMKLKPGEGYQQLLRALQSVDAERKKEKERVSRAQEEISSLHSSMAQRSSHYQSLQTELLDKLRQSTDTEKELKKKGARVAALERQLHEKTSAYGQAALKNTELENQLQEKTNTVQHYQALMTKKQKEYQQALEKCKHTQSQQFAEQQHRTEMLQLSVEEAQSRVLDMVQELSSLQRERDAAQEAAVQLQTSLHQLTEEKQIEVRRKDEMLQSLKEQVAQSADEVCELHASLSATRDELNSALQQTEITEKNCEADLQRSRDKVSSLQEKLHSVSLVYQSSSEQNLQLQRSLQQQQKMLTESTARVCELEESQSQLQSEVSDLERQLLRAHSSLQEEIRHREQDAQLKDKNLQEMNQQGAQLSQSLSHLTSEVTKCRGELVSKKAEVEQLRKEVAMKTSQISCLEESLQHARSQLTSKTQEVTDLEEQLRRCEADKLNCSQRAQDLEGRLKEAQNELADTVEQLKELRDVLQRTETVSDERQVAVEKLTVQLRDTRRELEERTHEVLDMDNALKERHGELQHRATLLAQLDVAIRDHKQEMERKVEGLQRRLEVREEELRDAKEELRDTNTKFQELSQQRLQKLFEELREAQCDREALNGQLDAAKLQANHTEARLCAVEEELTLKEAHWLQEEAELQSAVASLEKELEVERKRHSEELSSVQQSRGQVLKVSEQMSSTLRSSHQQLAVKLQQSQTQLEQAEAELDRTKAELDRTEAELDHTKEKASLLQTQLLQSRAQSSQLHGRVEQLAAQFNQTRVDAARLHAQVLASQEPVGNPNAPLLIKDSDASTRLLSTIATLGRAADRQNLYSHSLSLPALHVPSQHSLPAHSSAPHPKKLQTSVASPPRPRSSTHTFSTPPRHTRLPESQQVCDGSVDSSLDFPPSLKAALRDESPCSSSSSTLTSSLLDLAHHGWQGLSDVDATANSDLPFNPLTYMVDGESGGDPNGDASMMQEEEGKEEKEVEEEEEEEEELGSESRRDSGSTLVCSEDEADLRSLSGMLRFVNQTLAMQEDPSLWSSTKLSQT